MEELPEWLRAPRPRRSTKSNMAALSLIHFLPSSASVTSRIEQFEHLTGSSGSRLASSTRTMLGSSSSMSMRPLSVPVPCSQRFSATESRQGIHFDDTSSESESPSKDFLLLLCWLFCQNWIFHLDQFCLQIQEWWTIINHFFDGDPWHFTTYKLMKSSDNFFLQKWNTVKGKVPQSDDRCVLRREGKSGMSRFEGFSMISQIPWIFDWQC